MNAVIKLINFEINNVKNVGHGSLSLLTKEKTLNILGIYGQNGSGKTTVVKAIEILKYMMMGRELPSDIYDYLKVGTEFSGIKAEFELANETTKCRLIYDFMFQKTSETRDSIKTPGFIVSSERITYSEYKNNKWTRNNNIFEYDINEYSGIRPLKNYKILVDSNQDNEDDIRLMIRNQYKHPQSVLFAPRFLEILDNSSFDAEIKNLFQELNHYAIFYIMICDNEKNGIVNANIMIPFQFLLNYKDSDELLTGGISLMSRSKIPAEIYSKIEKSIKSIGKVISELVPNLSIKLIKFGESFNGKGQKIVEAELVSIHNGVTIPMILESDGIKKIVSILACIIVAFNNKSVLLAIDELDSGIFEFLLGEMLEAFYKEGKGQIVFTSHNFRALEILEKNNIIATTTNENNKFIRFRNIRPNNNLRDVFYHDLILGGQAECLYEPTNIYRISSTIRKAGDFID